MTSRSSISKRVFSIIFSLVLILTASLLFGQVLGNLYLENLSAQRDYQGTANPPGPPGEKTKVLRLKALTYFTIEAGAYEARDAALILGNTLAAKGLPVVIAGTAPSRVRLGFLNNEEKLQPLAQTILVDGKRATVIKGQINCVSFKFTSGDSFSSEKVAPFLGDASLILEKALLVNSEIDCNAAQLNMVKPKFSELAGEVEALAVRAAAIAQQGKDSKHGPYLLDLAAALHNWGQSLTKLSADWNNSCLLNSQQQALVVIEKYHEFLYSTN